MQCFAFLSCLCFTCLVSCFLVLCRTSCVLCLVCFKCKLNLTPPSPPVCILSFLFSLRRRSGLVCSCVRAHRRPTTNRDCCNTQHTTQQHNNTTGDGLGGLRADVLLLSVLHHPDAQRDPTPWKRHHLPRVQLRRTLTFLVLGTLCKTDQAGGVADASVRVALSRTPVLADPLETVGFGLQ